jgi:hypothetical protein
MNTKKSISTIEMLGYSADDLKNHLNLLFFICHGKLGEWHIDHTCK